MCGACGGKAGRNKVTPHIEAMLKKWAQPGWSRDVISYPTGICEPCRVRLTDCEKLQTSNLPGRPGVKQRWLKFNLENIVVPRGQLAANCSCIICVTRRSNKVGIKGFNNSKKEVKKIEVKLDKCDQTVQEDEDPKPCPKCFQQKTGRGIPHPCTEAKRKENLAKLVMSEKGVGSEQIVSSVLKQVIEKRDADLIDEVRLTQLKGGNALHVVVGKQKVEEPGTVDALLTAKLKKGLNLSDNNTSKMLTILRKGNVKVEKCVMHVLKEIGSTLEEEYEDVKMTMEVTEKLEDGKDQNQKGKTGKKGNKRAVVKKVLNVTIAKDAKALFEKVIEARKINKNTAMCRTIVDTGQGSLKVCTSIFDGNVDPDISFSSQEGANEKLTGVNRLIILAEIEGGEERHYNLRQILEYLQLHQLPGIVLVGDLSVTNVYLGISKHGGKYACFVCEGASTLESGTLRTFESLQSHYAGYVAAGSNPKTMQTYKNVVNKCLVAADPQEMVGEKIPLPELHLVIGVVNHYRKLLLKVWPGLRLWGKGKWTVHGWQGGGLDGANCMR